MLTNLKTVADVDGASGITTALLASVVFTLWVLWVLWVAWAVKLEQEERGGARTRPGVAARVLSALHRATRWRGFVECVDRHF